MQPKLKFATIYTATYTYFIHTDMTWGRFKPYKIDAKPFKIKGKEVMLERRNELTEIFGTTEYVESVESAFKKLGVDHTSKPDFDLKNFRAWADYIIG